ncbi:MAG: alpha/beta fold hydrolase [Bacteroidota bacterium]
MEQVQFSALDQTKLTGSLFEPKQLAHTLLLINSGTGIPRRFYTRFARHAAERGFAVLTYDYRGIGDSAPESLVGYDARYRDWGQQDVPGAINYLTSRYPDLPLTIIGHSTGGQQLGLAENVDRVQAAAFIAVSTGYWRGMPAIYKWFSLVAWKLYLPLVSRLYGYAPARKIRWGENLPNGVAKEWGAWCLEQEYLAAYFDNTGHRTSPDGSPFGPQYFHKVQFPIRAYYFTDDPIATPANATPMLALFKRAAIEKVWINPTELGLKEVGHLGFFWKHIGKSLWDETLTWLQTNATKTL